MPLNKKLLAHVFFWVSYLTAFWGAFEQAYDASPHPIISMTWDFPIPLPHHYVLGFCGVAIGYFIFTKEDWEKNNTFKRVKKIVFGRS